MEDFDILTHKDIFTNVVSNMSVDEIVNFCQVNKDANHACNRPNVWKMLIRRDFNVEPTTNDPRKEYIDRKKYPVGVKIPIRDILLSFPTFPNEVFVYSESFQNISKYNMNDLRALATTSGEAGMNNDIVYMEIGRSGRLIFANIPQNKSVIDSIPKDAF